MFFLKRILCILTLVILCSCSNEEGVSKIEKLTVDYSVGTGGWFHDLTINTDNNVYLFSYSNLNNVLDLRLSKISELGDRTVLSQNLYQDFAANKISVTNINSGQLYWLSASHNSKKKVLSFNNDYSQVNYYDLPPSSPVLDQVSLTTFCSFEGNSLIVFDYGTNQFKKVTISQSTTEIIVGSGNDATNDGEGLNAGLKDVHKMISKDNIVYFIDSSRNIRKMEYSSNKYIVSTLINNFEFDIKDIAIDSNNEIYVLVENKGIFKYSKDNSNLVQYKTGSTEYKIIDQPSGGNLYWDNVTNIYIKGNDLYLIIDDLKLIKIKDFQSKI